VRARKGTRLFRAVIYLVITRDTREFTFAPVRKTRLRISLHGRWWIHKHGFASTRTTHYHTLSYVKGKYSSAQIRQAISGRSSFEPSEEDGREYRHPSGWNLSLSFCNFDRVIFSRLGVYRRGAGIIIYQPVSRLFARPRRGIACNIKAERLHG